ncbi:MAG: recombinase family protein [Methanoregula sp.]|jgi:DNA invertase Pin-like site-specific DNA recombinase|nr:recombinase family protein [Methanoregula sp.]
MHDGQNSIGYARVSTDEQSTVNQIDKLRQDGVAIIFSDEGISGKKLAMERPEYREMIRYLEVHPQVKTIVVYELSRLGRNMLDAITTFITLEKQGYRIHSITEQWTLQDDPSMRSFMILIVSWMNEQELKRLSNRTKAGIDKARVHGTKSGKAIGRPEKLLDRETISRLKGEGKTWKAIADIFRVDESTLFRYRQEWHRKDLGRS